MTDSLPVPTERLLRPGRALVVGLGRSGVALCRFLTARGIEVRGCDRRAEVETGAELRGLGVELITGGYGDEVLDSCGAVFASPGVAWDSGLLEAARARGLPVSSEIDLCFRLCPAELVAITGTNGKTTTTALVGRVLERTGRRVTVGGNIGDTVLDRLDRLTASDLLVLEVSSFQLESAAAPRPRTAAILNLTPDHLDRHRTMEAYIAAKARLIEFQQPGDRAVLNGLDPLVRGLAGRTRAEVVWFDRHRPAPPMPIPGAHNVLNALAAAAIGRLHGLGDEEIAEAVAGFPGVEHRLELVGTWHGVEWFNDSKATNPEAAQVGLTSFPGRHLVLIAGGKRDQFELGRWLGEVWRRAAAVILIGTAAEQLAAGLDGYPALRRAESMDEAVAIAAELARPGGVVLLSPGFKSFDRYRSYEERGRDFKRAVRSWHGEPALAPAEEA